MAIKKNISLNIIAEVKDYQREMAKVPGITDKQAAAAARRLEKRLSDAQAAAAKSAQKAAVTGAKAHEKASAKIRNDYIKRAKQAAKVQKQKQKEAAEASSEAWRMTGTAIATSLAVGGTALLALGQGVADVRNELGDMSSATGISTENLKAIGFAAETSGGSLTGVLESLKQFPKRMLDMSRGTGESKVAFEALGISVVGAGGKMRPVNDVFEEAIQKLSAIEDDGTRSAYAIQLFGEKGAVMMQQIGGRELSDLVAFTDEWGSSAAPEAIASAEKWQETMAKLGVVVEGSKESIFDFLSLSDVLESFSASFIAGFVGIKTALDEYIRAVSQVSVATLAFISGDFDGAIRLASDGVETLANMFDVAGKAGAKAAQSFVGGADDGMKDLTASQREFLDLVSDGSAEGKRLLAEREKSEKAASKAFKESSEEAAKASEAWARAEEQRTAGLRSAIEARKKFMADAVSDTVTAEQRIEAAYEDRLTAVLALGLEGDAQQAALTAAVERRERDLTALVLEEADKRAAADQARADAALAADDKRIASARSAAEVITRGEGMMRDAALGNIALVSDAFASASRDRVSKMKRQRSVLRANIKDEKKREGGARDWVLEMNRDKLESIKSKARNEQMMRQAAGVTSILSNAAVAYMGIVANPAIIAASGGFGAPATAAAIIGPPTAIQLAAVRSQNTTFHTGTDEVKSTLLSGEAVLNRGGAERVGRDTIRAANRGESPMPKTMEIAVVFRDRVIDTMVSRVAQADGALSRLLPAPRMQLDPYGAI